MSVSLKKYIRPEVTTTTPIDSSKVEIINNNNNQRPYHVTHTMGVNQDLLSSICDADPRTHGVQGGISYPSSEDMSAQIDRIIEVVDKLVSTDNFDSTMDQVIKKMWTNVQVDELPDIADASENTVYLVKESAEDLDDNHYTGYYVLNGQWEKVGAADAVNGYVIE